jgi:hypothetical protein
VAHIHAYLIEKAHEDHALRNTAPWLLQLKKLYYELVAWVISLFFAASTASA